MGLALGRFTFEGLSDIQGGIVHVQAKGHALGVRAVDLPRAAGVLEFVLEPECRLLGLVVDEDGKPLLGRAVHFEGDRGITSACVPRSRGWQWEDACKLPITETDDWGLASSCAGCVQGRGWSRSTPSASATPGSVRWPKPSPSPTARAGWISAT